MRLDALKLFHSYAGRFRSRADLLIVAALCIFVVFGCFGRTVTIGKGLSNLAVLAGGDTFFNNEIRFATPRPRFDPSLYQFHIPYQLYAADQMKHLQLPLWNPCFGCGFPTVAELQYCTFSPLRGLFGAANSYLYNLGIVFKALMAVLGSYFLSRQLSASRAASVFAAIAYGMSPFVLRELELPNEVELLPAVASAFVFLSWKTSYKARFLLGLIAASTVYCMHPEFAFIAVVFATLISYLSRSLTKIEKEKLPVSIWLKSLGGAAIIGFLLTAPLLFPFLELLSNSSSYKFQKNFVQIAPLSTLLTGLITPVCKGGSPFIGTVAIALSLFSCFAAARKTLPLGLTVIFLILWISAAGPLASIVTAKPFCFIPPRYFIAPCLMVLSVLAGFGLDEIYNSAKNRKAGPIVGFSLLAGLTAGLPFFLSSSGIELRGFDGTLAAPAFVKSEFTNGAIALALSLAATLLIAKCQASWTSALAIVFILANLFSLGGSTRQALPTTINFKFSSSPTLDTIKASGERMTASGSQLFQPNISMAYGLRDARLTGPLIPAWVNAFRELKKNSDDRSIALLNDAASVKYIITRSPLRSEKDSGLVFKPLEGFTKAPYAVLDQISFLGGSYALTDRGELFVNLNWRANSDSVYLFATQLNLVDADSEAVRQGARTQFQQFKTGEQFVQKLSIRIPPGSKNLHAVVNIAGVLNEALLPLNAGEFPTFYHGIDLLNIEKTAITSSPRKDLELISEDENQVLLYKNNSALPQAYLTNNIVPAASLKDACEKLQADSFDVHKSAVIETGDNVKNESKNPFLIAAEVSRPKASQVIVTCRAPEDCYAVLTDTYYAGWQATVDDKPADIKRANVCFRAVPIPKGEHVIKFVYHPMSLYYGIALALLLLASIIIVANLSRGTHSAAKNENRLAG